MIAVGSLRRRVGAHWRVSLSLSALAFHPWQNDALYQVPQLCVPRTAPVRRWHKGPSSVMVVSKKRYRLLLIKNKNLRLHCAFLSWKHCPRGSGCCCAAPHKPPWDAAHCWQASWRSVCHLCIVGRHLTTSLSLIDHLAIHLFFNRTRSDQALKGGHVLSGVKIKIQLCWKLEMGRYCSRCRGKIAELKMFPQVDSSVCGLAPTSEQCLPSCADAVHVCGNLCSQQAACPRLILTWGTGKSFGVWRWEHRPQATLWPAAVMLSACKWPWWCTCDVIGKMVQNMVSKNRKTKPACDWNMHCKSHFSYLQRFMWMNFLLL